ncbi:MAG: hypothetical protein KBF82_13320 [Chitinophagaceae bacterium]|nr:hypothetical protein [Chitinophagaceae bacterium]MBP9104844.1 hypothetical protein [Chitinophagaceae bacterium]
MESKLIYIASEKLKGKIKWPKVSDGEWIYFGAGNEIKNDIVIEKINSHFSEQLLYVSWTRQDSFQTNRKEVFENIKHILGVQDFVIWNSSFSKAIEFNKIGVLRCGKADMSNISTKRQILEEAINDYPKKNLGTSKELLFEIHKIIPFPITYPKLKEYSDNLDLTKEAWIAESVESLLQLFGGQEHEPLERIIDMLDNQ